MKSFSIKVFLTFVLVGCASAPKLIPNAKLSQPIESKSFLIVPTGDVIVGTNATYYTSSSITGAVSALILNASEASKQEKYSKQRGVAYSIYKSGAIQNQIQEVLKKRLSAMNDGKNSISISEPTNKTVAFNDWYETLTRTDIDRLDNSNKDLIIDYGIESIKLYSNMTGNTYVEGSLGFRVIDPSSGLVLARAKVQSMNFLDVVRVKVELDGVEEDSVNYIEAVKKAYAELFILLSNRAIEQMGL